MPQKLPVDRLHIVALVLTLVGAVLMCIGTFLPNWWVLKQHMHSAVTTYSLFGDIHCMDSVCYPANHEKKAIPGYLPEPEVMPERDGNKTAGPVYTPIPGAKVTEATPIFIGDTDNATWLVAGRALCVLGLVLFGITVLLQAAFLKINFRTVQIAALGFLVGAAFISFVVGFHFINKFRALTQVYITERPPGSLSYTPAAPACFLIASLMCCVAAVFSALAFSPPEYDKRFS